MVFDEGCRGCFFLFFTSFLKSLLKEVMFLLMVVRLDIS